MFVFVTSWRIFFVSFSQLISFVIYNMIAARKEIRIPDEIWTSDLLETTVPICHFAVWPRQSHANISPFLTIKSPVGQWLEIRRVHGWSWILIPSGIRISFPSWCHFNFWNFLNLILFSTYNLISKLLERYTIQCNLQVVSENTVQFSTALFLSIHIFLRTPS